MAGIVESLRILLTADASGVDRGMKQAERAVKKVARELNEVASKLGLVGGAMAAFGGLMVREAAKYDSGVSRAVNGLKGAYVALAVEIGRALVPVVKALSAALSAVVRWFQSLSPQTKQIAATLLAVGAAMLLGVAVAGKLAAAFFALAPAILPLLAPLAIVIAVLGAIFIATALLRQAWDKNWGGMRDKVRDVIDFMNSKWEGMGSTVKTVFTKIADTIIRLTLQPLRLIFEALTYLPDAIKPDWADAAFETIKDMQDRGFKGLVDDAKEGFGIMGAAAKEFGAEVAEGGLKNLKDLKNMFADLTGIGGAGGGGFGVPKTLEQAQKDELERFKQAAQDMEAEIEDLHRRLNPKGAGSQFTRSAFSPGQNRIGFGASGGAVSGAGAVRPEDFGAGKELKQMSNPFAGLRNAALAAGAAVGSFAMGMLGAGKTVLSSLGTVGKAVTGMIDRLMDGDVWGAIGQFLAEIIVALEGFKPLVETAEGILLLIAPVFEGILKSLKPLVGGVGVLLQLVLNALLPAFEGLGPVLEALAPLLVIVAQILATVLLPVAKLLGSVLKLFADALKFVFEALRNIAIWIMMVVKGIADAWNGIVSAVSGILRGIAKFDIAGAKPFEFLNSWADSIDSVKIGTEGLDGAIRTLQSTTFDAAKTVAEAKAEEAKAAQDNAKAKKEEQKTIEKVIGALTNVPEGFKVAQARFEATTGKEQSVEFAPGSATNVTQSASATPMTVVVQMDSKTIAQYLEMAMRRKGFQQTGAYMPPP